MKDFQPSSENNAGEFQIFPVIRKRDGRLCRFDLDKISDALYKALYATGINSREKAAELASKVAASLASSFRGTLPQVEEIQDTVENVLIQEGLAVTAKAYILYRARRTAVREGRSELMDSVDELLTQEDFSMDYIKSPHTKMMRIAKAAGSRYYLSRIIPSQYADAHRKGEIFIHDAEYYGQSPDSVQLPLEKLLRKGFSGGYAFLRPPKRISSVASQATVVMRCCQNELFGNVAFPGFDGVLGSFWEPDKESCGGEDLGQAMEGFVYNLNTLYSRTVMPFSQSTISIGLDTGEGGRRACRSILDAVRAGLGRGETPMFPDIVFCVKKGVNYRSCDPNHDLFLLAVETACRRMNPSFAFMDAPFNGNASCHYWGDGRRLPSLEGSAAQGNIASVSVNLARAAFFTTLKRKDYLLSSFFNELKRVIALSCELLYLRQRTLGALKASDMPFLMQERHYAGSEGFCADDVIEEAVERGTLTLSFCGLAEALQLLLAGSREENDRARELGLEIVAFMREQTDLHSREKGRSFVLACPNDDAAAAAFAELDYEEFGPVKGVTEKRPYSSGFSFPASLDTELRLELEAPYHALCQGGHYFLHHFTGQPDFEEALIWIDRFHSSGIGCGGFNIPIRECAFCGGSGENCRCRARTNLLKRGIRGLELTWRQTEETEREK